MRWLITTVVLAASCFAQTQGNRPTVIDAYIDRAGSNSAGNIIWGDNVSTGQRIVLCFNTKHDGSTFSLADSQGNTYTSTTPTTTPAPGNDTDVWMAYTTAGSNGALTVTLTETSGTGFFYMVGARFPADGGIDGSVATQTAASPAGPTFIGTMTTSNTTTKNNDLLISCGGGGATFGGRIVSPSDGEHLAANVSASPVIAEEMAMLHAGAAGTITHTFNIWGGSSTFAMQTLAFKPASILLTDTAMPDAGAGVAYSAQLHGYGGGAGFTYACTGLPANGFSLNTGTGVISASNPTATTSIGCTVTDGTTTSATDNLTITVGSALNVPNIRQYNNTWSGDNGGGNFTMNAQCGSLIVVFARGDDTHGTEGWVQSATGTNNKVSDTFGSTVRRFAGPISGQQPWPFAVYIIGPLTKSGSDTVTVANNQTASSARKVSLAAEVTGAFADEIGAGSSSLTGSATGSFSAAYTTVVNNTLLLVGGDAAFTLSLSAPFSVISSDSDIEGTTIYGSTVVASPGATTATVNFSGFTPVGSAMQSDEVLVPLRPALPLSGCPASFGTGEKIRRQVY